MSDFSNSEEQKRLDSYLDIHLKNEQLECPVDQQIEALHKVNRKKWIMLGVNIAAVLIFGYSFISGMTQLSPVFFYGICAVFIVNTGLIFYQKKQIGELITYLHWKENRKG